MSSIRPLSVLGLVGWLWCPEAAAQGRLFPAVQSFELPAASPRVHGLVGRVLSARRGESLFGSGYEGEVVLGENIALLALRRGPRPIVLGIGSQVYGRFNLADSKTSLISSDWVAGLNTTAQFDSWALTLELYHESSHLGDEYGDRFHAVRLDWTREVLAGWVSYGFRGWRFTGGASYTLDDELRLPRPAASLGIDFRAPRRTATSLLPVLGIFTEATSATDWHLSTSAKVGLTVAGSAHSREVGLALIFHDGLSTQRQFFRRESRYIGLELRFDL